MISEGVTGKKVVSSREEWMYKPAPRKAERSRRAMAKERGRVDIGESVEVVSVNVVKIFAVEDWCCH